jgi:hypothetical protein
LDLWVPAFVLHWQGLVCVSPSFRSRHQALELAVRIRV